MSSSCCSTAPCRVHQPLLPCSRNTNSSSSSSRMTHLKRLQPSTTPSGSMARPAASGGQVSLGLASRPFLRGRRRWGWPRTWYLGAGRAGDSVRAGRG